MKKKLLIDFSAPLMVLLTLTLLFRATPLDLWVQRLFWSRSLGWRWKDVWLPSLLYEYGPAPALVLAILSLILFIASFRVTHLLRFRRVTLFIVLLMILGPGLIVNAVFKDHWGRPRPREVVEFTGYETFLPVWTRGTAGQGRSFPSGHASMGFFWLAPYFILRPVSPAWSFRFFWLGISFGLIMGISRIIQGGHFASDVLWSGGFVYLTGLSLYYALGLHHGFFYEPNAVSAERWGTFDAEEAEQG